MQRDTCPRCDSSTWVIRYILSLVSFQACVNVSFCTMHMMLPSANQLLDGRRELECQWACIFRYTARPEAGDALTGHVESARSALHFADTARRVALTPEVNLVLPPLLQIRQLRADNTTLRAQLVRG